MPRPARSPSAACSARRRRQLPCPPTCIPQGSQRCKVLGKHQCSISAGKLQKWQTVPSALWHHLAAARARRPLEVQQDDVGHARDLLLLHHVNLHRATLFQATALRPKLTIIPAAMIKPVTFLARFVS